MQELTLEITPSPIKTKIIIGRDILSQLLKDDRKTIFIADEKLKPYLSNFCNLIFLKASEKIKTRSSKALLENRLFERKIGRDWVIVAIGGGTLLDLVGFVASTYHRGIPFISVPTTLLSMVDGALGGKVGINTAQAKNGLGAFYFPEKIIIDLNFLNSLPKSELEGGLVESIKHALIGDPFLFELLEKEECDLERLIPLSLAVKKRVIESDPFERERRKFLNLGHTLGHALETASRYKISHGAAIKFGLIGEAYIAHTLGYLGRPSFLRIINLLNRISYSWIPVDMESIIESAYFDKKGDGKNIPIVILKDIGIVKNLLENVSPELAKEALHYAMRQSKETLT